jgi:hypothetical protein
MRLAELVHAAHSRAAASNTALHLTAYSVRSSVAPAVGGGSPPAFGISIVESRSMEHQQITDVQHSYDRVADEYVQRIFDELQHKPLDRQLLEQFAVRVHGLGPVCDLG